MHTPAVTKDGRGTLGVEALNFASEGQQGSGVGGRPVVRPGAEVKLFDDATVVILKTHRQRYM